MKSFESTSLDETRSIARAFIKNVADSGYDEKGATVIGLSGELGSGKTAFVQAIAETLGVHDVVTSPTFVIIKCYDIGHEHFKKLFHIDAYRLKSGDELIPLSWRSIVKDPHNLVMIEWPEFVLSQLPTLMYHLTFTAPDEHTRNIEIEGIS